MTSGRTVLVQLDGNRLCLVERQDDRGTWFAFPDRPGVQSVPVPFDQVVHQSLHPTGTAERVLAAWARGELVEGWTDADEPGEPAPTRRRGGAVVLSAGRMLLIRYPPRMGLRYFVPGGGVEEGERPATAAVRELREETGLVGTVERHLATIYNRGREEHYFLVQPESEPGKAREGDLKLGETLEWVNVSRLPGTPVWPRRLAWRINHWHTHGWPTSPLVLADSSGDLHLPCTW